MGSPRGMADSSVTRRPPHTGRARFRKIPSLFALEKCQSGSDMGSPQVGFCAGRHCLASGAWWGLSGRSGCEVQVWGLTTPQAIPAGYPGHRSTRRLPVTASGLPRQGLGVQCPAEDTGSAWGGHAIPKSACTSPAPTHRDPLGQMRNKPRRAPFPSGSVCLGE